MASSKPRVPVYGLFAMDESGNACAVWWATDVEGLRFVTYEKPWDNFLRAYQLAPGFEEPVRKLIARATADGWKVHKIPAADARQLLRRRYRVDDPWDPAKVAAKASARGACLPAGAVAVSAERRDGGQGGNGHAAQQDADSPASALGAGDQGDSLADSHVAGPTPAAQ